LKRRTWLTIGLVAIAAGFAIRFGLKFPWAHTADTLADANPWLLLAAALVNLASLAAKATSWQLILRRLAPVRLATAQAATFLGAAVNSISISVNGEIARAQLVKTRDNVPFGAAVASLLASRVIEALGLLLFLALALAGLDPWPRARWIGIALGAVAAAVILAYRLVPWRPQSEKPKRWHETFIHMAAAKHRGGLAAAIAFATFNWVGQWLTYHWSIAATHVPVTPAVSLTALVVANVVGILRLTPGNLGVMQGSLILGMHAFSIGAADALAAGVALQAVQLLPILVCGMAIAGRQGLRSFAARRSEAL
jgi:uncharacterized membrane protein YbhN (UPF0104 family)